METKIPELRMGIPVWCHIHGSKMQITSISRENRSIRIAGSAASCLIRKASYVVSRTSGWFVDYEINHSVFGKINGCIEMNTQDLKSAFGLSDESGEYGDQIIERYGADVANQGIYIRYKNFLNIPGPGTGNDGDANISIHLDEEIKNAIKEIL